MVRRFVLLSWWFFFCGVFFNVGLIMVDDDGEFVVVDGFVEYFWLGIWEEFEVGDGYCDVFWILLLVMLGDFLWLFLFVGWWNSCEILISLEVLFRIEDKGLKLLLGLVEFSRRVLRMLKFWGRDFVWRSCFERFCCRFVSKIFGFFWWEDLCVGMGFMVKLFFGLKGWYLGGDGRDMVDVWCCVEGWMWWLLYKVWVFINSVLLWIEKLKMLMVWFVFV